MLFDPRSVRYLCRLQPLEQGHHQQKLRARALFWNRGAFCHLIIFREFAERPWLDTWWSCLLSFMRRLSGLPDDSLHLHILRDNIAEAQDPLPCANWARGIEVKFAALGMASPFVSSGIGALDGHGFIIGWSPAMDLGWPACVP